MDLSSLSSALMRRSDNAVRYAVEQARESYEEGDYNSSLNWISFAGTVAWHSHPGYFVSEPLERILRNIGRDIKTNPTASRLQEDCSARARSVAMFAHVFTTAYERGGHTRLIARWIENCVHGSLNQSHSMIITNQGKHTIPKWLEKVAEKANGHCLAIDNSLPPIEKALKLRMLCDSIADVIVLHIHPNDPLPAVAFSESDNTRPIIFFNHADHVFSIGTSVAHMVFDIRESGQRITVSQRGNSAKSSLVPIPLIDPMKGEETSLINRESMRKEARSRLGIRSDARVAISIGEHYKYEPRLQYDFRKAVEAILNEGNDIHIFAIGLPISGIWKRQFESTGGRFHPTGIVDDQRILSDYYLAADVYLEGFPITSITALLDAGLYYLPIQSFRVPDAPILSCDDVSTRNSVPFAYTEEDYASGAIKLLRSSKEERHDIGKKIRIGILREHCGAYWTDRWLEPALRGSWERLDDKAIKNEKGTTSGPQIVQDLQNQYLAVLNWNPKNPECVVLNAYASSCHLPLKLETQILTLSMMTLEPFYSPSGLSLLGRMLAKYLTRR